MFIRTPGLSLIINAATDKLGPDLGGQIEDENTGSSFATGAVIVINKPAKGSFFLQHIEIDFASDIDWTIVPDHVQLSQVSLGLSLDHAQSGAPWVAQMNVDGIISINDRELSVSGEIALDATTSVSLAISAGSRSGTAPEDVLDLLIGAGTDSRADSLFQLPPTADLPQDDESPFEAALTLQKDVSGWYIQNVTAKLFWQLDPWFPIEGVNISLSGFYFEFLAQRELPPEGKNPSDMSLDLSAAFGGSMTIAKVPIAVVATYQSTSTTLILSCLVDDTSNLSLQDIARDPLLNPPNANQPHDLVAQATTNNVPDSVPIDLEWCSSPMWATKRYCILTFTGSNLTELQLKANFELNWQITSQLTITGMGIYFDITNPISTSEPSTIKGYAYGSVLIANAVNLFAFTAGVSQPSGTRDFVVGLSLSYDPIAGVGVSPQSIFNDPKFFGQMVATDLWTFPSSAPTGASVSDTATSVNAQVTMRLRQTADASNDGDYTTSLLSLQASLQVSGAWTIFDTVSLDQLALNLIIVPGATSKDPISYYAELLGTVGLDLSKVGSTQYVVVLAARLLRNAEEQASTFTATISAYYVGDLEANVPISAFFQMPLIGVDTNTVLNDPSTNAIPSELSLSPATLLAQPVAQCSLVVQQANNAWTLKEMDAQLHQVSDWVIVPDKIKVTDSFLNLKITDPKSSQRTIDFVASTTIQIGTSIIITASISVHKGQDGVEDSLSIVANVSNFQSIVSALTNSTVAIPADCPSFDTYSAMLTIICKQQPKQASSDSGFGLSSIDIVVAATNLSWTLGPLAVTNLGLSAAFDFTKSPTVYTFAIGGRTLISGVNTPLDVIITLKNSQSLSFVISTPLEPTQLVSLFSSGGLDSGSLQGPDITADTGLSGYRDTACAGASITFLRGTAWYADNLMIGVNSGTTQWSLVTNVLWAQNLSLAVVLNSISTNAQLSVVLNISFGYHNVSNNSLYVPCALTATSKQLNGTIDTSTCTLQSFLHVGTAGWWNPPDLLNIKLIKSLQMTMDWDDGTGNFVATCFDWTLTDSLPRLAAMTNPRLEVDLKKGTAGFEASGQLIGDATLAHIPAQTKR